MVKLVNTCENKRAHAWDKARQKTIEGEGSDEQTVQELQRSGQQDVEQVCIHHFQLVGSRRCVLLQKTRNNRYNWVRHDWE